jgi:type II secretory pathway predicted ATPase ExeA
MYLKFYQLREEPFSLTPDPRFLHLAQPYRVALETVVQSIIRRKGFVVVNGPIGTGKTTLLHAAMQVLSRLNNNSAPLASAFVLNPTLSREEFLETLITEFEVSCTSTSKPARLAALQKMFLEKQKRGGTSILIVDEAHLLTIELLEEIRLISNADTYREKLLQVILCGQPELMPMLQLRELRALQQRITQYCSLRPLSLPETHSYVAERLQAAGLTGASPFCSESIELVHRYSQGVPRLINQVCDGALVIGFSTGRKEIQPHVIEESATQLQLSLEPTKEPPKPTLHDAEMNAARTAVDLLIDAMKRRRAAALE